ncbi:deoxynucleotide monophosphate kinase [Rhizobium sp. SG741]|uniref:deoxynucleotide monophosphate kinase family protein n=1 Tax=Rhizobium sp. SG741 TaxID=2587114 RepID=UPI00185C9AE1|nr:deoxynucleotide monophosphate kinase [Rhizobium sp. SG741]NKJ03161.1 hypothetical protein [Rhizobium sp. SG741]
MTPNSDNWSPWTVDGDLIGIPCLSPAKAANDNNQVAALGAAIGKAEATDCGADGVLRRMPAANDNFPDVVAFTGVAGSGKSTATRHLVERRGYKLVKFAGPLKDMMRAIGLTEAEIEGALKEQPSSKLLGKTPRHAMQTLGTEWGRGCIGEDLWISLWRRRVEAVLVSGDKVVVDDCRLPNEAAAIRKFGGNIYLLAGRGGIAGNHASEKGCEDMDAILVNQGSIDELYSMVDDALRRVA